METSCLFTGDHAEINALTRAKREERQKIFANLPQKTQELLIPKPSFFDGSIQDAEKWFQTTKDFASFNQMELSFAFDMLLRDDASCGKNSAVSKRLFQMKKLRNGF